MEAALLYLSSQLFSKLRERGDKQIENEPIIYVGINT